MGGKPVWRILITLVAISLLTATRAPAVTCSVTATGLNFSSYDIFSGLPTDSTSTIRITCNIPAKNPNAPIPVTATLTPGNSGSFSTRQMRGSGPDPLLYNLYANSSFSAILGDGSGNSVSLSNFVSQGTPWSFTVYGRIPPRQNISPGVYSDVITVTILW